MRPTCYRCFRPSAACLCAWLVPVQTTTTVVILQHPGERRHPFGTVKLLRQMLPNLRYELAERAEVRDLRGELERPVALLFPGPSAQPLEERSTVAAPRTLVVLDGTWSQARSLYYENQWIRELDCCTLTPREPSSYRIRREPSRHCLSTLEATEQALAILEPENRELSRLSAAFDAMIDGQLAISAPLMERI